MKDMWNESSQNTNLIISNSLAIFEIVLFIAFKIKMKILNVIYTDCHILALTPPPQLPVIPLAPLLSQPRTCTSLFKVLVGAGHSLLSISASGTLLYFFCRPLQAL